MPALFDLLHDTQSIRVGDGGAAYSKNTHRIKLAVNEVYSHHERDASLTVSVVWQTLTQLATRLWRGL